MGGFQAAVSVWAWLHDDVCPGVELQRHAGGRARFLREARAVLQGALTLTR